MTVLIRNIQHDDWSAILRIQAQCYHALTPEPLDALRNKVQLSPATCWVAEHAREVLGYLLCHPWHDGPPPSLSTALTHLEGDELFYMHDLAISPNARGLGIGQRLIDTALNYARQDGYEEVALVAVQDAPAYWLRQGFSPSPTSKCLSEYGPGAQFMKRWLGTAEPA